MKADLKLKFKLLYADCEEKEGVQGEVEKQRRGEGGNPLGDRLQTRDQQGPKLVASPSHRQRVRAPGACETRTCLTGNLSCRSISALAGRLRALSWAGYVSKMYHEHFSCQKRALRACKHSCMRPNSFLGFSVQQVARGANPSTA